MKKRTNRLLALALSGALTLSCASVCAGADTLDRFTDVNAGSWYADYVSFAVEKGLMSGTSDTTFEPDSTLTREMFVTVLSRLAGAEIDTKAHYTGAFTDVEDGQWYSPFVQWAEENAVTSGKGNGAFGVGDPVTREEMAVFINAFLTRQGVALKGNGDTSPQFGDEDQISGWAVNAADLVCIGGIMTGDENGNLNPQKGTTRAEAAVVFKNVYGKLEAAQQESDPEPTVSPNPEPTVSPNPDPEPVPSPEPDPEPSVSPEPSPEESEEPAPAESKEVTADEAAQAEMSFAVDLLRSSFDDESNTLESPLSVITALAMVTNGAEGETKEQLEEALGLTAGQLNTVLSQYMANLPDTEKLTLHTADSIWIRDDENLTVQADYLKLMEDYYNGEVYVTPFDNSTVGEINSWVSKNTDGMINKIVDSISSDTVMHIINALYLDASWDSIYYENQVGKANFTCEDGTVQTVQMMKGEEYNAYLADENCTGFIKYYERGKWDQQSLDYEYNYAFVALLPNEGTSMEDFVNSLTGNELLSLLENVGDGRVSTGLPKFSYACTFTLNDVLKEMGVTTAFNPKLADFTPMASYTDNNIYIDSVVHKTYIEVAEDGTRAAAVTDVSMNVGSALMEQHYVTLNRPFLYMIVDMDTETPVFIGTVMNFDEAE